MEQLTGRLTADAKVSTVKGDKKVVNFNIAINDSYRSNGETVRVTTYVDCAYWINAAIAEYLKKGLLVELFGRIGSRAWIDKDGAAQSTVTLNVSNVKFLGGASATGLERQDGKSAKKETVYNDEKKGADNDDLPF
jgi:single-strand DNA-binding protein